MIVSRLLHTIDLLDFFTCVFFYLLTYLNIFSTGTRKKPHGGCMALYGRFLTFNFFWIQEKLAHHHDQHEILHNRMNL